MSQKINKMKITNETVGEGFNYPGGTSDDDSRKICNDAQNTTSHITLKLMNSFTETGESTITMDESSSYQKVVEQEYGVEVSLEKNWGVKADVGPSVTASITASYRHREEETSGRSSSKGTSETKGFEKTSGAEMELTIETPPRTLKTVKVFSTKSTTSKPWTCDVELVFEKGFILK